MIKMNPHYKKLNASYLFSTIAQKINEHQNANPESSLIRLGIGDVTHGLAKPCVDALKAAADELGTDASFRGYGPEQGYAFLRETIAENDYRRIGADVSPDEIFVSDGAKCDSGNFLDILANDIVVGVPDPVYPVYVDTNVMAGRTGIFSDGRYDGLHYLVGTVENGFVPSPPSAHLDLIYLCFPNNPTGASATRSQLSAWVSYAREHKALILFDAAYERFIQSDDVPHSIYEIDGARSCAVEIRSFSKTAGFTGTRCAFTVVPKDIEIADDSGDTRTLHSLWNRRQSTKFNGVSYPVQRAAEAVYSPEGRKEVDYRVNYYMENAGLIRNIMTKAGYSVSGGVDSPYIWVQTGTDSWSFFDRMLTEAQVVITPGVGFGRMGEGFIRISAFNHREKVEEAMERITRVL
ncbi:MAG: LL-diaminopimelate aminotransferase [Spirochaetaceae bacterium]|nr:MAG: LL-diaminopimelate aminotransferase [Spirochaetaceae bacterium]